MIQFRDVRLAHLRSSSNLMIEILHAFHEINKTESSPPLIHALICSSCHVFGAVSVLISCISGMGKTSNPNALNGNGVSFLGVSSANGSYVANVCVLFWKWGFLFALLVCHTAPRISCSLTGSFVSAFRLAKFLLLNVQPVDDSENTFPSCSSLRYTTTGGPHSKT